MSTSELATLLVATATLVSALAGLVVAIRTGQKTAETHQLVNGQSEAIQGMREQRGFALGVQAEIAHPGDNPPSKAV